MTDRSAKAANTSLWARSGAFRILVIVGLLVLVTAPSILLIYFIKEYAPAWGFVLVIVLAVLVVVGRRRLPRKPKGIT